MPDIEDTGCDGHPFAHIDFASDAGAWADVLPYCLNITILPDMDAQQRLDPVEGVADADGNVWPAVPDALSSFHTNLNTDERKPDHGA